MASCGLVAADTHMLAQRASDVGAKAGHRPICLGGGRTPRNSPPPVADPITPIRRKYSLIRTIILGRAAFSTLQLGAPLFAGVQTTSSTDMIPGLTKLPNSHVPGGGVDI